MEETFCCFCRASENYGLRVLCFDHSGAPFQSYAAEPLWLVTASDPRSSLRDCFRKLGSCSWNTHRRCQKYSQRFAAVPRGHGKGNKLSVTQVAEFTPCRPDGTLADHHALSRPSYACTTEYVGFVVAGIGNHMAATAMTTRAGLPLHCNWTIGTWKLGLLSVQFFGLPSASCQPFRNCVACSTTALGYVTAHLITGRVQDELRVRRFCCSMKEFTV